MHISMLMVCSLFISTCISAGVAHDTLVQTPVGQKELSELAVGDTVVCCNQDLVDKEHAIELLQEVTVPSYVEITTVDDVVLKVSPQQQVFVPCKWLNVEQLTVSDVLLTKDKKFIRIKSICVKDEPITMRFITVQEHHNFFATKNGVLIHNGLFGANAGFWAGKFAVWVVGHGTIAVVTAGVAIVSGPAALVVGQALESTFAVPIEAASTYVGLCTGVAGAVATGPV